MSEAEYRAREEAWLSQRQGLAAIDQRITTLSADLSQARIDRDRTPLDSADRMSRLSASQAELRQRLAEVDAQGGQLVHAPMAGRVTSMQANVGQRLDPVKPALTIVPEGATLQAELLVTSRAIGFIQPGQEVRIMYDAFPYQLFGTHRGIVERVSHSSFKPEEYIGQIYSNESVYKVSIKLDDVRKNPKIPEMSLFTDMKFHADIILSNVTIFEMMIFRTGILEYT